MPARILARENARSTHCADRCRDKVIPKPDASCRERIQMRGLYDRMPCKPESVRTQIVGEQDEQIRPARFGVRRTADDRERACAYKSKRALEETKNVHALCDNTRSGTESASATPSFSASCVPSVRSQRAGVFRVTLSESV
jgi:hypothetical protein